MAACRLVVAACGADAGGWTQLDGEVSDLRSVRARAGVGVDSGERRPASLDSTAPWRSGVERSSRRPLRDAHGAGRAAANALGSLTPREPEVRSSESRRTRGGRTARVRLFGSMEFGQPLAATAASSSQRRVLPHLDGHGRVRGRASGISYLGDLSPARDAGPVTTDPSRAATARRSTSSRLDATLQHRFGGMLTFELFIEIHRARNPADAIQVAREEPRHPLGSTTPAPRRTRARTSTGRRDVPSLPRGSRCAATRAGFRRSDPAARGSRGANLRRLSVLSDEQELSVVPREPDQRHAPRDRRCRGLAPLRGAPQRFRTATDDNTRPDGSVAR